MISALAACQSSEVTVTDGPNTLHLPLYISSVCQPGLLELWHGQNKYWSHWSQLFAVSWHYCPMQLLHWPVSGAGPRQPIMNKNRVVLFCFLLFFNCVYFQCFILKKKPTLTLANIGGWT